MKNEEKERPIIPEPLDEFCSSCSSGDCTGLIPAGGEMDEETFMDYKKLYPFSVPEFPEK